MIKMFPLTTSAEAFTNDYVNNVPYRMRVTVTVGHTLEYVRQYEGLYKVFINLIVTYIKQPATYYLITVLQL